MELTGVSFSGRGKFGDFSWMIEQPEYADALFVFPEYQRHFLRHRTIPFHESPCMGFGFLHRWGFDGLRSYQCEDPPRSAGIPVCSNVGGYKELNNHSRKFIDRAISEIGTLIETGQYRRVFFCTNEKGEFDAGHFPPAKEVNDYIVARLKEVAADCSQDRSNRLEDA